MHCYRIAIALLFFFATSLSALAQQIEIYTWEDYLSQEVVDAFTKQTGHTVKQVFFDDEGVRDAVISSGRGIGYDLILLESVTLQVMAEQGLLEKLDEIRAPFAAHIDPQWLSTCTEYGVPYSWGTTGVLYRSSVAAPPISSWKQLFEPPQAHRGRVVMYMDLLDAPATALLATGAPPFSEKEAELAQAYQLLKTQQPHLLEKGYGAAYASEHGENSTMSLTLGYSGDEYLLQELTGQEDWVFVVPEEGTTLWNECWVAPKGRSISTATKEFLHFINQPEHAAKNAEEVWFATPNRDAIPLTGEDYQEDNALFPPADILEKSTPYKRINVEGLRLRNRMINSLM